MGLTYLALNIEPANLILNNTLYEFQNEYEVVGNKNVTKTSNFIENYISETFEFYDKTKSQEVSKILLEFIWIWVFYFFMFAKKILKDE